MYIKACHIQNFCSFKDVWFFPNKTLNCIIGPNNSGKSTLINALSIVLDPKAPIYREDFITLFDFYNCDTTNPIIIDVWLNKHETENDSVQTRIFDKFSRWRIIEYGDGHPEKLEPVITEPFEEASTIKTDTIFELLRIQFIASWDEITKSAEYNTIITNEIDDPIEPFTISLRKLIGFNSISSNRLPLRDISLSKRGVLAQFLDDNEINPHFRDLIEVLEKNKNGLLSALGVKEVIDRLKRIVASQVVGNFSGQHEDAVSITFLNSDISKLRNESSFSIKVGNKDANGTEPTKSIHVPLEYQGDGIQNLFLIITLAEIIKQHKGTNHFIVTLEEPEQHLEPSQVKWVYSELCKCFNGIIYNQLFITSHSPSLVGEINGTDSLILMPVERHLEKPIRIANASYLSSQTKKTFERYRDSLTNALLAKYILVVEGPSELGFLPVAFRHLSEDACKNPFHLGLEIINGEDKLTAIKRAGELLPFGRPVHVLIDHDPPTKTCTETTEQLLAANATKDFFISCWSREDLLSFTCGGDLEQLLVKEVNPTILLEAIIEAYQEPGHEFNNDKWESACKCIKESTLKDKIEPLFPKSTTELTFSDSLKTEIEKQAYLLVLLHAPHCCKSVKEMRIIAEYLANKGALPISMESLLNRVLSWIIDRNNISKHEYIVGTKNDN